MATANTSNISLVHRHFSSEKRVDPLNAANIFNVHAFLQCSRFYDKVSVSSRHLSQVSVSEVTVLTASLVVTHCST